MDMTALTYGIIIVIPMAFLAWGLRKIASRNKEIVSRNEDLLHRDLCILLEKDFADFADREELAIEDVIKSINTFRTATNSQIKNEEWHLPLLSGTPSISSKA